MNLIQRSHNEIHAEIQQLNEQLVTAQHRAGNLGDARLRMYLQLKIRQLDAEMEFMHRKLAAASEWIRKPR